MLIGAEMFDFFFFLTEHSNESRFYLFIYFSPQNSICWLQVFLGLEVKGGRQYACFFLKNAIYFPCLALMTQLCSVREE